MSHNVIEDAPSWPLAAAAKADREAEVMNSGAQSGATLAKTQIYLDLLDVCAEEVGVQIKP